jgi:outer membrane PBP1 activator LpoA protein
MQKHHAALSTFQFKRATTDLIHVFNEGSYLMAEYNERTGVVKWQRVLLATQREVIENWLRERYPAHPAAEPAPPAKKPGARSKASGR